MNQDGAGVQPSSPNHHRGDRRTVRLRKPHRMRVLVLGLLFAGLSAAVAGRLYTLQYKDHDHYRDRAQRMQVRRVVVQPERGDILDRDGRALAQSMGRVTVSINPSVFDGLLDEEERRRLAGLVAEASGEDFETVHERLTGSRVTGLVRRIRPENATQVAAILAEANPTGEGFWLDRESIRVYPRHLAAAVIGFNSRDADGDNIGLAGIELQYNEQLRGQRVEGRASHTAISQSLEPWDTRELLAARGNTLVLTLDANVQEAVERILGETVEKHDAASGGVIIMDPHNGDVLAMASYPTFDNNRFATEPADHRRNRTLTDPLETGSVAKLFTAAMLLDNGIVGPETLIDCEGGYAVVDGRRVRDAPGHTLYLATFREVMRWSSNVGIVKAALAMENEEWYASLRSFGFGAPTGVDLPGEGSGILYPLRRWTRLSRTSLPMGYEIAMTPMQIAAGISALVNGGVYYQPRLVSEIRDSSGNTVEFREPKALRRVIRPTTSAIIRDLMEDVVAHGTGKPAQVEGYRVGGKTGTTRKSDIFDRREYIASFGGALPANDPRLVIYLYIDAPQGEYYASRVAAPAFQEIARAAVLHLGIPASDQSVAMVPDRVAVPGGPGRPAAPQSRVSPGRMPDLLGLTMTEARDLLPPGVGNVRFLGSGEVSDQYPPSGEIIGRETEIVLHFSTPEERATELAGAAATASPTRGVNE